MRRQDEIEEDIRDRLCTISCAAALYSAGRNGKLSCDCKCRGRNHGGLWHWEHE